MTTSGTTSDNEWQWVTISANFLFFLIKEEPTAKQPKENSLNLVEDLWSKPIKLRPEKRPYEEILTVRRRMAEAITDFLQNKFSQKFCNIQRKIPVLESLFNNVAGLESCKSIKRRLQHSYFPVNITKFLRTAFSIEHLRWLLLKLRVFLVCDNTNFRIYEDSMTQT